MNEFYVIGGPVKHNAPSYVPRKADTELFNRLRQGEFCHVLTPRQMGKTSLVVQTKARLKNEGAAVAVLDLQQSGQNVTSEQWYRGLVDQMGSELNLEDELDDFWRGRRELGPLQRFTRAIREVVLAHCAGRLVIFVDEVDFLLSLDFQTDEFLAGLRGFYNRRNEDPDLARVTVCLLGVLTPSDLIRDLRTTPFNIGQRIELADFTEAEAELLSSGMGRDESLSRQLLKRALYWTSGQPYLTQRLCKAIADRPDVKNAGDVDRVCRELFLASDAEEQDNHLAFVSRQFVRKQTLNRSDRAEILSEPDRISLLNLYAQVHRYNRVRDQYSNSLVDWLLYFYGGLRGIRSVRDDDTNPLVSTLQLSGITRVVNRYLYVRNRIYHSVFDQEWVKVNLPEDEQQRQRAAFWRGLRRAAIVAAPIILAMFGLWMTAVKARQSADENAKQLSVALLDRLNALDTSITLQKEFERQRNEANAQREIADKNAAEATRQKELVEAANRELIEQKAETEAARAETRRNLALIYFGKGEQSEKGADPLAAEVFYAQSLKLDDRIETRERLLAVREKTSPQTQTLWEIDNSKAESALAYSLDGQWVAAGSGDGKVRVWHADSGREIYLLSGHAAAIRNVAFSPDSKLLVSASTDKTARMWSLADGKVTRAFSDHGAAVTSAAFSPDGKRLVSCASNNTVRLWDVNSGKELLALRAEKSRPAYGFLSTVFSSDGRTIFAVSSEGNFYQWNAETGEPIAISEEEAVRMRTSNIESRVINPEHLRVWLEKKTGNMNNTPPLASSPTGERHVRISTGGEIGLYDDKSGKEILALRDENVVAAAFSSDGRRLVSLTDSGKLKLRNLIAGKTLVLRGHDGSVTSLAFSADKKWLASGGADSKIRLWDWASGKLDSTLVGHKDTITSLSFSPSGDLLASSTEDSTLRLWDIATKEMREITGPKGGAKVVFSPDGKYLAAGSRSDGSLRLWNMTQPEAEAKSLGYNYMAISDLSYSPDGSRIAIAGGGDNSVQIYDAASRRLTRAPGNHESPILGVTFDPIQQRVVTRHADGNLIFWPQESGKGTFALQTHNGHVRGMAFRPDGLRLATVGGADAEIRIWEPGSNKRANTLGGHSGAIYSVAYSPHVFAVAFSPEQEWLAAAGSDGSIRLSNMAAINDFLRASTDTLLDEAQRKSGTQIKDLDLSPLDPKTPGDYLERGRSDLLTGAWKQALVSLTLGGHRGNVSAAVFSPDGRYIATVGANNEAHLWDAADGALLAIYRGFLSSAVKVAVSPDSKRLLTTSAYDSPRVWAIPVRTQTELPSGHSARIRSAAFSPNNKRFVTASEDGTAKIWDLASGKRLVNLNEHVGTVTSAVFDPSGARVLTADEDHTARTWDAATGKLLATTKIVTQNHTSPILGVAFGNTGKRFVTWDAGGIGRIWETASGTLLYTLEGHQGAISSAEFDAEDNRIITIGADKTAKIWNAATGKLLSNLSGKDTAITSAVFSRDGLRVLTRCDGCRLVGVWDAVTGNLLMTLGDKDQSAPSATFSPDGRFALIVNTDGSAKVWDAVNGKLAASLPSGVGTSAQFSPDGSRILTTRWSGARDDGAAKIWDAVSGKLIATLSGGMFVSARFSPDGSRVLARFGRSNEAKVEIWDINGKLLATLAGFNDLSSEALFSPDGKLIATLSSTRVIKLWDASAGQELAALSVQSDPSFRPDRLAFTPDGKRLALIGSSGWLGMLDIDKREMVYSLKGKAGSVIQVNPPVKLIFTLRGYNANLATFSPDGKLIVTASNRSYSDSYILVWDAENGKQLAYFYAAQDSIHSMQFSHDGRFLVTAGNDLTVRLWDMSLETRSPKEVGEMTKRFIKIKPEDSFPYLDIATPGQRESRLPPSLASDYVSPFSRLREGRSLRPPP